MIRPATSADKSAILEVAVDSGLFPAEHTGDLADMMDAQLGAEAEGHHWIVRTGDGGTVLAAATQKRGPRPISPQSTAAPKRRAYGSSTRRGRIRWCSGRGCKRVGLPRKSNSSCLIYKDD